MEGSRELTRDTLGALVSLLVGFVFGVIVILIYWLQRESVETPPSEPVEVERVTLETVPVEKTPELPVVGEAEPDDLTRIDGIGPKISSVLEEAGITSFEELAERDPDSLNQILRDEGLQFADPGTWPEQATLAAADAWEALDELQRELSGGRRVEG
jgi:small subunit ribosomal protein S2